MEGGNCIEYAPDPPGELPCRPALYGTLLLPAWSCWQDDSWGPDRDLSRAVDIRCMGVRSNVNLKVGDIKNVGLWVKAGVNEA